MERDVTLRVEEGPGESVVVTEDGRLLLRLDEDVALDFADELTIVAEKIRRRRARRAA